MGGPCQSAPLKLTPPAPLKPIHPLGAASGGTGRLRRPRATPAHLRLPPEGLPQDPTEGREDDLFDNQKERDDLNHGHLAGAETLAT